MRVAVFSDIHGNLPALEAVLDDVQRRSPDVIVVAGDLVNRGPQSAQVVSRLRDLNYPTLKGNHERYLINAVTATDPREGGDTYESTRWAMRQLSADQIAYLNDLPTSVWVEDCVIVHASPRHDQDGIFPKTSDTELNEKLHGFTHVVCGHTHLSLIRPWRDGLVVNAGSVGNSFEGDTRGRYAWLERRHTGWDAEIICVDYDVSQILRAFDESDYLESVGPMARLFRLEFATGRNHLIPAYLAHRQAIDSETMTLAEAAARYLKKIED